MEDPDEALADLVRTVRLRIMGARIATRPADRQLPIADMTTARELARAAARAVADGSLGYALFVAREPGCGR